MDCPPVRGDNLSLLASGLYIVQVDKYGMTIFTTYISIELAHQNLFST